MNPKKLFTNRPDPSLKRECGTCTVCCTLPRVVDAETAERSGGNLLSPLPLLPEGKAGYTPCRHLYGQSGDKSGCAGYSGCSRYSERPRVCDEFMCLWKFGLLLGDERRRPDHLGLMLTLDELPTMESEEREEDRVSSLVIDVWEVWEGACRDHPGRGVLDVLIGYSPHPVTIRYYGVPCSLQFKHPSDLLTGAELSRLAREDPRQLARWVRAKIARQELHNPESVYGIKIMEDLDRLERGECVKATFKPRYKT